MPDCFWTGFIGSYASECGADTPPPDLCDGVPPYPDPVDIFATVGGPTDNPTFLWLTDYSEEFITWTLDIENAPYLSPPVETAYGEVPANMTIYRRCDAAAFVVPIGNTRIVLT